MRDHPTVLDRILCRTGTAADRRNQLRYMVLAVAFALAWAGVSLLIADGTIPRGLPAIGAVCLPGLLGLALVWAFIRFLRETDELQRRLQLEGMAWGFAAGLVWTVLASLVGRAGASVPGTANVAALMLCAYALGVGVAAARYGVEP